MKIEEKVNPELHIKPFDNQMKGSSQVHPDLPQHPFTILAVCPKGGGKTTNIIRLIWGNKKCKETKVDKGYHKFYRHFFSRIFVFSPTWALDDKTRRCKIPEDQIFDDPSTYDEILQEIVAGQIEDKENGELEPVLLIFSDLAGSSLFSLRKDSVINRLAFNSRHFGISMLLDSQSLRQISNPFRENLSAVLLFGGISNRLELKKIYDEFLGRYNEKEAKKIMEYVFKDSPYNFLTINFQQRGRLFRNWNPLEISDV